MTGIILLQKSEGSGMSGSAAASMFGGALTGAAAGNFLTKLTTWLAVIFFVLCAALAIVSAKSGVGDAQSGLREELAADELAGEPTPTTAPQSEVPATPAEPVSVDENK